MPEPKQIQHHDILSNSRKEFLRSIIYYHVLNAFSDSTGSRRWGVVLRGIHQLAHVTPLPMKVRTRNSYSNYLRYLPICELSIRHII